LLSQLEKQWAERKAKQLALAAEYEANNARMGDDLEKARQDEYRRMIWLGAYGPRALLPAQGTEETSNSNGDNAEPSTNETNGVPSKPRIRNRTMAPPAPPENGWGWRLRRTRADRDGNEDEDGQTDSDGTEDGEEEIERTTKRQKISNSGESSYGFSNSHSESANTGLDMVFGEDNRGSVSETSSKSKRDREVNLNGNHS
jgi:hypothetical protein